MDVKHSDPLKRPFERLFKQQASITMSETLPDFARQWMNQWKQAAIELPKVRTSELRQLRSSDELDAFSLLDLPSALPSDPHQNGLVIQQKWFMRQQLLQLAKQESNRSETRDAASPMT